MRKKVLGLTVFLTVLCVPLLASAKVNPPELSHESGVYLGEIELSMEGGNIYYTTDGSVPTEASSRYSAPIKLSAQTETYTYEQGKNMFKQTESFSVPKASVIRAAVIENGESSSVVTKTYFVGNDIFSPLGNIPIASMVVTPYDLWDSQNGIYSNYNYEHKVPAVIQYLDSSGTLAFDKNIEVKVSGHGSRDQAKKSLRIYTEKKNQIKYDLIPGTDKNYLDSSPVQEFYKATFRISDWTYTNLRDVVAQKLGESTRADTANSAPAALFLNGSYWGMYECREQYDKKYLASHYDIDDDDVVFLDRDWTLGAQYDALSDTGTVYVDKLEYSEGPADGEAVLGESYYRDQWRYVQSLAIERDITDETVYAEFCANVDIDNFIDYLIVYLYSANDDWPGNNFKFWRVTEDKINPDVYGADGKWRFLIHDFDIAFEKADHNTLYLSALQKDADTEARHPEFATRLLGNLLKNKSFRDELAQRTLIYSSTLMNKAAMQSIVNSLSAERRNAKYADLMRWNLGTFKNRLSSWESNLSSFVGFAEKRGDKLKNQYTDILNNNYSAGISGTAQVKAKTGCSFELGGAMLKAGEEYNANVFAGIPVRVEAEGMRIKVVCGDYIVSSEDSLAFTPQNGKSYTLKLESRAPYIETAGLDVTFRSDALAKAVLAYYAPDGTLKRVASAVFEGEYKAEAEANDGEIKAMLWHSGAWGDYLQPLCQAVTLDKAESSPRGVGIARSGRFSAMSVGESLPVFVFDNDGNRVEAEIEVEGGCAAYENGMLTAAKPGSGRLAAKENGNTVYAEIVVK